MNRIVNFFHDRFWQDGGETQMDWNKAIILAFKHFVTNIALAEGNYYVIKGGYLESECEKQNSGRWKNGYCYTLEHQNGG